MILGRLSDETEGRWKANVLMQGLFTTIRLTVWSTLLATVFGFIAGIPVVGAFFEQVVLGHNVLVYLAFLAVPFTWWVVYRTRFGLRLRAVGENPAAVDTAGISVIWLRYRAVGKTYLFEAAVPREKAQRLLAGRMIDSLFKGSAERLVMTLLEDGGLKADEAQRIREMLDEARTEPSG